MNIDTTFKQILREAISEVIYIDKAKLNEILPPGFSPADLQSMEDFSATPINEADEPFLGAATTDLPEPELKQYMQKIADREKDPKDKYKYPYIHRSNIVDDSGNVVDPSVLKTLISQRPESILKQNKKMQKSGGDIKFYDISLPALRGIIVDETSGEFKIVDTCPGAGACRVYCYARKGGYVQWKRSSLLQTRVLNFLLNDWEGFKTKLSVEINQVATGTTRNKVKVGERNYNVIIRWHDSGDFMSEKYLNIAFDIARQTPNVLHYAYTKRVTMVSGANKPDNFVFNFSQGAVAPEEKKINPKIHKHSVVVPKQVFADLVHKNKETDAWDFNSNADIETLRHRMSLKYSLDKDSILTYDELMNTPEEVNREKQLNIIVKPGDGDDAASRRDVLGTYLLVH